MRDSVVHARFPSSRLLGLARLLGPGTRRRGRLVCPRSDRVIAAVMAFGSGVLISALSFELMDEGSVAVASVRPYGHSRCSSDYLTRCPATAELQANGRLELKCLM